MHLSNVRARVAIGSAVLAIAGLGTVGQLTASASTPPSSDPSSSEPTAETITPDSGVTPVGSDPAGSAPALDPEREALVDEIVTSAEAEGFPLDRDCLSAIVAHVPDADIAIIAAEVAEPPETAMAVEVPGPDSVPSSDGAVMTADTMVADTMAPMETTPQLSAEAEALGDQIIDCVQGDADPALVAEAMAIIAADESAPEFDLMCVENILTTFADETLQLIIDNGVGPMTDVAPDTATDAPATDTAPSSEPAADAAPASAAASEPITSAEEDALEEGVLLLVCSRAMTGDMTVETLSASEPAGAPVSAAPVTEAVTETTAS